MDTVLIIDDERGPRESLRQLLKHQYVVWTAESVDEGLDIMRDEVMDVVIMDICMPGKSGIDGLREIRLIDKEVAIIILTGFSSINTAQDAVRLNATDYITKPFDTDEMRELVYRSARVSQFKRLEVQGEVDLQVRYRKLKQQTERKKMLRMSPVGTMRE